ncbi:MAG: helix-turn-helix transcriptional regulator [Nitrospiraceae bacterium]|jgi:transcriptional regulator with XRE-family HTH domain|nr:helix-turn-helix transcriptional regulator [Nitrospiraceae bacterium]
MRAAQRLGKQLQRVRTSRGLTQEQLAVNVGLSGTFVTRLELGQYDPTLSTLVRLAKALRVSVTNLLGESMSGNVWWQVGEQRFPTREEAEDHARPAGDMFVARYQNKPNGSLRSLLPIREKKTIVGKRKKSEPEPDTQS